MITIDVTEEAKANLKSIADFISKDNPVRAKTYTVELLSKARERLQILPESCPFHNKELNIRKFSYGKYNVYYQYESEAETASIIFILHSALAKNQALKDKGYQL